MRVCERQGTLPLPFSGHLLCVEMNACNRQLPLKQVTAAREPMAAQHSSDCNATLLHGCSGVGVKFKGHCRRACHPCLLGSLRLEPKPPRKLPVPRELCTENPIRSCSCRMESTDACCSSCCFKVASCYHYCWLLPLLPAAIAALYHPNPLLAAAAAA